MVPPEPAGPVQGARPERREGSRPRTRGGSVQIVGASGQGVTRENIVRGTGVGSVVGPSQASTSRRSPIPSRTASPMVEEETSTESANVQFSSATASEEETTAETENESAEVTASESNEESSDSDDDDDEPSTGDTRRAEGVSVENIEVSREKERRSKIHNERTRGIEGAVVDLAGQLHTPPDTLPSLNRWTRVPFSATAGGLSGPAGTPIVIPTSVGLQGLGGSLTIAIITPAVNVGGSTSTVVTRTGSLNDPGVTYPEFVSREFMDGALKAVHTMMQSEMREEVDALKCLIKGTGPATEPEPLPPTPQPSIPTSEISIDDLKSILLAKLLAQSQTEPTQDVDLLTFLLEDTCRSQAERLKRRHDDQDDLDHHEGEKSQHLSESEIHLVGSVQVEQEEASGSGTQPEGQGQAQG
ncbi:hypothetical protein L6452_22411 [Arctium lappa]|uniref:Uncharacterized protein n=1 Tax=Arctium lappa TaxID=4217 RepID=A0ACB9AZB6_ARCLA|nr:hypothetical protein L6452_22411 [Arctium lappa]